MNYNLGYFNNQQYLNNNNINNINGVNRQTQQDAFNMMTSYPMINRAYTNNNNNINNQNNNLLNQQYNKNINSNNINNRIEDNINPKPTFNKTQSFKKTVTFNKVQIINVESFKEYNKIEESIFNTDYTGNYNNQNNIIDEDGQIRNNRKKGDECTCIIL